MLGDPSISLENTMRALLLIAMRGLDADAQVETLSKAGFGNTEISNMTGMTPNAVNLRKIRLKKKDAK